MEASTMSPEQQAQDDELERARARREELTQKAQERADGADGGSGAEGEGSPGDAADGPDAALPAPAADAEQLAFEGIVGGKRPTAEKVRITGAVEIPPPAGGWRKGETYVLRVEVTCDGVTFKDVKDSKTGQVVGCHETRQLKIAGARLSR